MFRCLLSTRSTRLASESSLARNIGNSSEDFHTDLLSTEGRLQRAVGLRLPGRSPAAPDMSP